MTRMNSIAVIVLLSMSLSHAQKHVIFESNSYTVYSDSVRDDGYYKATAYSTDGISITSPLPPPPYKGTNTVQCYVEGTWTPESDGVEREELSMYPTLSTGHKIVDAIYINAITIFHRSTYDPNWTRGGELEGLIQGGYRQCEGYNVWRRDAVYNALLMGNLFDPTAARKTLKYVITKGLNQTGEDGWIVPSVGVWDYYLATGDKTLIEEVYQLNKEHNVCKIQYDQDKKLIHCDHHSFVDTETSEESGGYAFSTNIIAREMYRVLAKMGAMMGEEQSQIQEWERIAADMKAALNDLYWNPEAGYYTPAPRGNAAYEKKYWENLGQSFAVWPRFDIADSEKRKSVLANKDSAWTEWGFMERFYKGGPCKYTNPVYSDGMHDRQIWPFTEVGEAVACARTQNMDLLLHIFASILRDAAMNKTFMELICGDTGHGSRYPGQLWHALGWISMIYYGMLGMEYDLEGLHFDHPCVPEPMANMKITNFKYRKGVFDINVNGWGYRKALKMDGNPIDVIQPTISGNHTLELEMTRSSETGSVKQQTFLAGQNSGFRLSTMNGGTYEITVTKPGFHEIEIYAATGHFVSSMSGMGPSTYHFDPAILPTGIWLVLIKDQDSIRTLKLMNAGHASPHSK